MTGRAEGAGRVPRRAVLVAGLAAAAGCARGSTPAPGGGRGGTGQPAAVPSSQPAPNAAGTLRPAGPLPPGAVARQVAHGRRDRPEVALTFHGAGDPALAADVLGVLARARASVTVLAVGRWLASYPDMARRVVGGGHELGNHTWSHPVLDQLGEDAARVEIERCRDLLVRLAGSPGAHFRQSGRPTATPLVQRLAGAAGYPVCLSYDVDSRDFTDPGPVAVRATVAAKVAPGSIVSLHLGHPGTRAALPGILADLHVRGLRPVTAAALLRP